MGIRSIGVLCVAVGLVIGGCGKNEPAPSTTGSTGTMGTAATTGVGATVNTASAAEAQKLMDQATQYIKDNKLDLADKTVTQLEGMKGQLPAEYGPKIDELKKMVDAAKTGLPGGMKLPS